MGDLIQQIKIGSDTSNIASTAYGVCDTAADQAAKTVSMAGFKLVTGVTVHIKFTYANTATDAPTLSINSSTAKPIVQYGSTAAGTTAETSGWQAGAVLSLTYDGTSWVRDQGYNTNTVTTDNDYRVRQTVDNTTATARALILSYYAPTASTSSTARIVYRANNLYAIPSTGGLYASTFNDLTLTKATTGFTIAGGTTSKTLTVGDSYTLNTACEKGIITDFTGNTSSTDLPTTAAVASYISGLGYTTNTGTVTGITIQTSSPLTGGSSTAATTTGTWTIGFDSQNPNTVLAGPSSGGDDGTPNFRSLVAADLPTVTVAKGGTNISSYTVGDILYASGSTALSKLAGNTTTTRKFLTSVATTADTATAPSWETLTADDIPNLSWNKITSDKPTTLAGYGITDAAASDHVHGNITNAGKLGTANRIVWTDSNKKIYAGYHYANTTQVAINSSSAPSENFYVNGTVSFKIGTSNTDSSNSKFTVVGTSDAKLSIGSDGLQAYTSSDTATTLNLQKSGGNLQIGSSTYESATRDLYGIFDFKTESGFKYSAMTAGTHSISRPIWFMSASGINATTLGVPQYDDDFSYNPSTNTLTIGTGTLTATNYDGTAAKATADASGNTITTTYAPIASPEFTGTPKSVTPTTNSDNTMIATKEYVDNSLSVANALTYKGVLSGANDATDGGTLTLAASCGDVYKVDTAGYINGIYVQVGDMLICDTDTAAATTTNYNTIKANWNIIQTSEGTVTGPTGAANEAIARFDGVTGQFIQDSIITISDDGNILIPHTQNKTTGIQFTYSSTIDFSIGVSGTDNITHGLYDAKATKWILSAGSDNKWSLDGNASTATKWASAQTVYVTLGTASTATTIQGGSSSAQTIGVDGILGITNGGTGTATAPTQGGLIYGSSTTAYACTSAGTSGQVIISKGTNTPEWYTGLTLLSTTTESNNTSITTYEAIFGGTVTATTYYGALEQRSSTDNVARSVWFSYYNNSAVQDGVLAKDSDFTYNPSTNVLKVGKLTITGGTTNSTVASSGSLTIKSGSSKTMAVNSGSTLTLNSSTATSIIFSKNDTAAWRFTADGTAIQPETSGAINLGSTTNRWGALYIGSSDDYGDEYTPVYWNNGLPTASYPVQYFTWTINSGKTGVVLTHDALTEDTFPLTIVVTSGEEDLTGPITWNNTKSGNNNQFELSIPSALPSGKTVSGYCIVARGTAITPISTNIPSSST